MSKLIVVVLAGALAAVLFFWRKSEESWSSMWGSVKDSGSSWSETAAHESRNAADTLATAADQATTSVSDLADDVKRSASHAAHKAGEDASTATTNVADEIKDGDAV